MNNFLETFAVLYMFIPQEILVIIFGCIIMWVYMEFFLDGRLNKREKCQQSKPKRKSQKSERR